MQTHADINWTNISINQQQHTIMLFDLAVGGHHPSYISHLVEYWCAEKISGKLYVVVSPKFLTVHSDVVNIGAKYGRKNLEFLAITQAEYLKWKNQPHFLLKVFQEWHLFCKYSRILKSNHSLLLYFDHFQLPLALGLKAPCTFSGIYFRPTFHYAEFENYKSSGKDTFRRWRQILILSQVLKKSQLTYLLCLDPFAIKFISKLTKKTKILYLPDPVDVSSHNQVNINNLKKKLGIDDWRKTFLFFGRLNSRKGIYQLLDAISLLSTEVCEKLCLLIVGNTSESEQIIINTRITELIKSLPIQIISHYKFISETEVNLYFQISEIVLAPYQHHVGMSGILLLAAAANKPVLSSDYGLMGEITKRYKLGLTVDSTKPQLIAQKLAILLLEPTDKFCDREKMTKFVCDRNSQYFAQTIFSCIKSV